MVPAPFQPHADEQRLAVCATQAREKSSLTAAALTGGGGGWFHRRAASGSSGEAAGDWDAASEATTTAGALGFVVYLCCSFVCKGCSAGLGFCSASQRRVRGYACHVAICLAFPFHML